MSGYEIKTINDMELYHYSRAGAQYIGRREIRKDDAMTSSTTGAYNAYYGAMVWAQLNLEANAFGSLPSFAWTRSGWRIMTTKPTTVGSGVQEGGALPATDKPDFVQVKVKPKQIATNFDNSDIQEWFATQGDDDAIGSMEDLKKYMASMHREAINAMILYDASAAAAGAGGDRTSSTDANYWYRLETLDRIVSSGAEETAFGGSHDNWFDPYIQDESTFDRDSGTTYDSYVNHASGVDRSLTDNLIMTTLQNVRSNGGNPQVWLTGHDTYAALSQLYSSYVRYNDVAGSGKYKVDVNGISTPSGTEVGLDIPTLYGIPIILSKDVPEDTISRMYLLDTSDPQGSGVPRLGYGATNTTRYYEAGMTTGDPFSVNRLGTEGMFLDTGEIVCRAFNYHGKLRDLKT